MTDYEYPSDHYPFPHAPYINYPEIDPTLHHDSDPDAPFRQQTLTITNGFGRLKNDVLVSFPSEGLLQLLAEPEVAPDKVGSLFEKQPAFTPTQAPVYEGLVIPRDGAESVDLSDYTDTTLGLMGIPFADRAGWPLHPAALIGGLLIGYHSEQRPRDPLALGVLRTAGVSYLMKNAQVKTYGLHNITLAGLVAAAASIRNSSRLNNARVYAAVALPGEGRDEQYSLLQDADDQGRLGLVHQLDNGRPGQRIDPHDFLEKWAQCSNNAMLIATYDLPRLTPPVSPASHAQSAPTTKGGTITVTGGYL